MPDRSSYLQELQPYSPLLKTCEQLVYTVQEKSVGKIPQLVWTTLHTNIQFTKPVQKWTVFRNFLRVSSTNLPTGKFPRFYLLDLHLPTLSTLPITTTTVYINNK
jgi:hypothetical protein